MKTVGIKFFKEVLRRKQEAVELEIKFLLQKL